MASHSLAGMLLPRRGRRTGKLVGRSMGVNGVAAGGSSLTSPSSAGSCLDEAAGTGREGGGWGGREEDTEDVRGRLLLERCSGSGSCRRLRLRAGDDSREAGGDGGSSAGSGALTSPSIYGEKRVNEENERDIG